MGFPCLVLFCLIFSYVVYFIVFLILFMVSMGWIPLSLIQGSNLHHLVLEKWIWAYSPTHISYIFYYFIGISWFLSWPRKKNTLLISLCSKFRILMDLDYSYAPTQHYFSNQAHASFSRSRLSGFKYFRGLPFPMRSSKFPTYGSIHCIQYHIF